MPHPADAVLADPAVLAALAGLASPPPGTEAETLSYALREEESPEAGEFTGGHCEFALVILLVAAVVAIILLLQKDGKV